MARDASITVRIITERENMTATPTDLPRSFREQARYVLDRDMGERASGRAAAYLDCAERLEAALRAEADAKAEAIAAIKTMGTGKATKPPAKAKKK